MIASLPFGHAVEVIGDAAVAGWKSVRTQLDGLSVSGVVAGDHLREPASEMKEALIAEAAAQWERFDRGQGPEAVDPFAGYVGEMWRALGMQLDGRDTDQPWSAAFISFVARRAGYEGFKFAAAHASYIHNDRQEAGRPGFPVLGFPAERAHAAAGRSRLPQPIGRLITFAKAAADDEFISHCDIVIQVGDRFINVVGGNVGDSVRIRQCVADDHGRIVGPDTVFAILRNNR